MIFCLKVRKLYLVLYLFILLFLFISCENPFLVKLLEPLAKFTVTYYPDGGIPAPNSPVTMKYGSTIKQPSAMTKSDYIFDNWYMDSAKTIPVTFPIIVTSDVNLFAKWISKKFTVTYYPDGGTPAPSSPIIVENGSTINQPSAMTKSDYIFDNWYMDSAKTIPVTFPIIVTSDVNLYAKWISYTEMAEKNMVFVPGGSFEMGDDEGWDNARPVHTVILSDFYIGKYTVTQEQYQAVMGNNPSYFTSSPATGEVQSKRPVECVSWYDTLVFCNKLSIMAGLSPAYRISGSTNPNDWGIIPNWDYNIAWDAVEIVAGSNGYRLPTEAQWEYACRAGTTTAYNTGDTISDNTGWYNSNSGDKTHEVGKKSANAWGLHDMHGNVWEWCWDWYGSYSSGAQTNPVGADSGYYRVLRGGSWNYSAGYTRSSCRDYNSPENNDYGIGFRLVRP